MFSGTVREIQNVLIYVMVLFALTLVGVYFVGAAAVAWLAPRFEGPLAGALVGAAALSPLVIVLLINLAKRIMRNAKRQSFMESSELPDSVRELVETVQRLTRTAPIAAVALAVVAGIVLMRYPASLPLIVSAFAAQNPIRPT